MNRPHKKSKTSINSDDSDPSLEKQVELALSSLGSELTQEYFRASEVTPTLVRKETRIADFLRAEHYDPENAAKRLARYWKTRKFLFGERWLLPMTLTGTGCLDANQIEILRSGFISVVNSPKGLLLINDFAFLPKGAVHAQLEVLFYFLTIYPCASTGLHVVRHGDRPAMTVSGLVKQVFDSVANTTKSIDVVRAYEEGREHLLDFLGYQQRRVSETNFQSTIGYIAADSVAGTLRILKEKGFDSSNLPVSLGGKLDRNYFDNWVRTRLSIEDIMSGAPIMRNHSLSASAAMECPSSGALLVVKPKTQRDKEALSLVRRPDETPAEFAKRKNAVYVRRNYHRQKLELMAAEGEVARCRVLNESLKLENQMLERLKQEASWWVQRLEGHMEPRPIISTSTGMLF
uniref:CRAL-TRIO domain-containing protein n=1 Tax=Amphora coffeiformis TaxID=265554 RepID=A0A7S3LDZ6_9STRA|mmetsp:Transcript_31/g.82  ORF Transcript_31/g.82 Transcript_31/m.82 type:complete len:404 (-) Transcript_31:42-1253(-)|eukprot:scaffold4494_cov161-Amphora_coffeaeformis.AAC.14